jgi:hypothetical protein
MVAHFFLFSFFKLLENAWYQHAVAKSSGGRIARGGHYRNQRSGNAVAGSWSCARQSHGRLFCRSDTITAISVNVTANPLMISAKETTVCKLIRLARSAR